MKLTRILYTAVIAVFFCTSAIAANTTQTQFNAKQVQAIQQVVHDYLIKNPQILVQVSQVLQKQQFEKNQKASEAAIAQNAKQLFDSTGKPVAGNKHGNIVMIEFSDYQCPHCIDMAPEVAKLIKANPNLKVIFAELPIFGAVSKYAAEAALASMQQDKYYAFHNALFKAGSPLTKAKVIKIAKSVGLNISKLKRDMKSKTIAQQFKSNFDLAKAIKLIGTPTFAIGNLKANKFSFVPGQVSPKDLQEAIDKVK